MAQISVIDTINGILVDESGRLDQEILQNTRYMDFWTDLGRVEPWPEHMGAEISVATYEPTRPASQTWTKVRPVDGSGESVNPTPSTVVSAKTMQSWTLYQTSLMSEKLNVNDLLISVQCEAQLNGIYDNLSENMGELMRSKSRADYMTLSKNHISLDASFTEGTVASTTEATREISNTILGRYRSRMILGGAGLNPLQRVDGKPIFGLACGEDVSESLKAELGENLRFAGRADEMLRPYGCDGVYQNFVHMTDFRAPRYTFSGTYTEVLPYTTASDSLGSVPYLVPNPLFETAPFTDTIIYHQDVVVTQFPNPKTSGEAAGVSFDARNYRGEWTWENIKSHEQDSDEYNPLGQIGFFLGVVRRGSKPGKPRFGYVFRHLRPGYTN
jgi:hypothetical protein